MTALPDLVAEAVGDEPVIGEVDLGGDDLVVATPAATYLYRSEGLLSDESVETFDHDVERFATSAGRRKTTFQLTGMEGEQSFTVGARAADRVLRVVLQGILQTTGVVETDETVEAVYRFSELTLVVTDRQLLKHVGGAVWDDDFEAFRYADLIDLDFEEGSVATQVVVETTGRRQRVKVPNEHGGRVREDIQSAVFEFHEVSSLGGLRAKVAPDEDEESTAGDAAETDPATARRDDGDGEDDPVDGADEFVPASSSSSPPADQDITGPRGRYPGRSADASEGEAAVDASATATSGPAAGDGDIEAELAALNERLANQTELLEAQQETLDQLVEELRRGR